MLCHYASPTRRLPKLEHELNSLSLIKETFQAEGGLKRRKETQSIVKFQINLKWKYNTSTPSIKNFPWTVYCIVTRIMYYNAEITC